MAAASSRPDPDSNSPTALNWLGYAYAKGVGVTRNDAQSVRWFHTAAEHGDEQVQYNLGVMYEVGRAFHAMSAKPRNGTRSLRSKALRTRRTISPCFTSEGKHTQRSSGRTCAGSAWPPSKTIPPYPWRQPEARCGGQLIDSIPGWKVAVLYAGKGGTRFIGRRFRGWGGRRCCKKRTSHRGKFYRNRMATSFSLLRACSTTKFVISKL